MVSGNWRSPSKFPPTLDPRGAGVPTFPFLGKWGNSVVFDHLRGRHDFVVFLERRDDCHLWRPRSFIPDWIHSHSTWWKIATAPWYLRVCDNRWTVKNPSCNVSVSAFKPLFKAQGSTLTGVVSSQNQITLSSFSHVIATEGHQPLEPVTGQKGPLPYNIVMPFDITLPKPTQRINVVVIG